MLERVCMRSDGVRNDSQRIPGRALCLMEKRLGLIARCFRGRAGRRRDDSAVSNRSLTNRQSAPRVPRLARCDRETLPDTHRRVYALFRPAHRAYTAHPSAPRPSSYPRALDRSRNGVRAWGRRADWSRLVYPVKR